MHELIPLAPYESKRVQEDAEQLTVADGGGFRFVPARAACCRHPPHRWLWLALLFDAEVAGLVVEEQGHV